MCACQPSQRTSASQCLWSGWQNPISQLVLPGPSAWLVNASAHVSPFHSLALLQLWVELTHCCLFHHLVHPQCGTRAGPWWWLTLKVSLASLLA
jgi:hypothetical protein